MAAPLTVTQQYNYKLGPVEEAHIEILNERYGRIAARRWHASRSYSIELATLDPTPTTSSHIAYQWLISAIVTLLVISAIIAYLFNTQSHYAASTIAITLASLAALMALFAALFVIQSFRRITFCSRFSQIPLIDIPLPWRHANEAKQFANEISRVARERRKRIDRTEQEMRAGEMRMLRRLSEEGAIDSTIYDQAKSLLLNTA